MSQARLETQRQVNVSQGTMGGLHWPAACDNSSWEGPSSQLAIGRLNQPVQSIHRATSGHILQLLDKMRKMKSLVRSPIKNTFSTSLESVCSLFAWRMERC